MTANPVFRDADSVKRGPLPVKVPMDPVTSGAPSAREDVLLDEGGEFFAVWACDAGVYPRVKDKRGSFMYLLEGAGAIVDKDGTAYELGPDSILILPFGWEGHWNITETVRKVYVHTTPVPPYRAGGISSSILTPLGGQYPSNSRACWSMCQWTAFCLAATILGLPCLL